MKYIKDNIQKIPSRMLEFRNKYHYPRKVIARLLGIRNPNVITCWENGTSIPKLEHFLMVLELYNTTPEELYGEYIQLLKNRMNQVVSKFTCPIFPRTPNRSINDNENTNT